MKLASSYYLWLMPEQKTFDRLHKIIQELSRRHGTPLFEPHVTLVSGLRGSDEELMSAIEQFAGGVSPLATALDGMDYTHGFFTALFIRTEITPEFVELNTRARALLKPFGQGSYEPHLSLLYGEITVEEKERIIEELNHLPKSITLDRLQLVEGNQDVTRWRVVKEWPLH